MTFNIFHGPINGQETVEFASNGMIPKKQSSLIRDNLKKPCILFITRDCLIDQNTMVKLNKSLICKMDGILFYKWELGLVVLVDLYLESNICLTLEKNKSFAQFMFCLILYPHNALYLTSLPTNILQIKSNIKVYTLTFHVEYNVR